MMNSFQVSTTKIIQVTLMIIMSKAAFSHDNHGKTALGPVTYTQADAVQGERIEHGERVTAIDEAKKLLHAQHHPYTPLATFSLPSKYKKSTISSVEDYAVPLNNLPLLHPGPGEHVHVMEGKRYGYNNLSVGVTNTQPGGSPPMHTHPGEESHVLLDGTIKYAVGEETFVVKAPYIMQIPAMTPHSFINVGDKVARLVVIFPTNVWEYDVLDVFPFEKKSKNTSK